MEIPLLKPEDVELRVAQITTTQYGTYANLLLYKDARCDQRYLDLCFGSMNWQRSHQLINGSLFCTVSIWDENKQAWISKQDVGSESNTEAIKGACSDSFKRACFNIGIGRELYDAPIIRVKLDDTEVSMGQNGKPKTYAKFKVLSMSYNRDKHCFTDFTVVDTKGNVRFSLSNEIKPKPVEDPTPVSSAKGPEPAKYGNNNILDSVCADCGAHIASAKIIAFSKQRYHRPLCYSCQKVA